jgi:hypothetical protein
LELYFLNEVIVNLVLLDKPVVRSTFLKAKSKNYASSLFFGAFGDLKKRRKKAWAVDSIIIEDVFGVLFSNQIEKVTQRNHHNPKPQRIWSAQSFCLRWNYIIMVLNSCKLVFLYHHPSFVLNFMTYIFQHSHANVVKVAYASVIFLYDNFNSFALLEGYNYVIVLVDNFSRAS